MNTFTANTDLITNITTALKTALPTTHKVYGKLDGLKRIETMLGTITGLNLAAIPAVLKSLKKLTPKLEFDNGVLTVRAGNFEMTLLAHLEPTRATLFGAANPNAFTLELDQSVWKFVDASRAKEEFRAVFRYASIYSNGELVSTDGFRLHCIQTNAVLPKRKGGAYQVLIPFDLVKALAKTKKTQTVNFNGKAWVWNGKTFIIGTDSELPDWKRCIPSSFDQCFIDIDGLRDTLKMAFKSAPKIYKDNTKLELAFSESQVKASIDNDLQEFRDSVEVFGTGEITLAYRLHQLIDAFQMTVTEFKTGINQPAILDGTVSGLKAIAMINPLRF
jgi:hypothetical protein